MCIAITYILIHVDVLVTIGLQQGYYSVLESSNLVQVCVEVVSGEIVERSIAIDYTTLNGSAEGIIAQRFLLLPRNVVFSQKQNGYLQQCSAKVYKPFCYEQNIRLLDIKRGQLKITEGTCIYKALIHIQNPQTNRRQMQSYAAFQTLAEPMTALCNKIHILGVHFP